MYLWDWYIEKLSFQIINNVVDVCVYVCCVHNANSFYRQLTEKENARM